MDTRHTRSIGIAGLGLIGGSLVQALAQRQPGIRRLGFDVDAAAVAVGVASGSLHAGFTSLDALLAESDLVVLCQPMPALLSVMHGLGAHARLPVLCDVGSVKAPVQRAAQALGAARGRFVGAHPIAGKAESGWSAAEPGLFDGRLVVLCPGEAEPLALAQVRALWEAVGAHTVEMDAVRHDTVYGALSHLPQLLTWAYLAALADEPGLANSADFAGPGFASFTRLGRSDPGLWTGIALQNREMLLQGLDRLDLRLAELRTLLARGDAAALCAFFDHARRCPVLEPA